MIYQSIIINDIILYVMSHRDDLHAGNMRKNVERLMLELEFIECVKVGMILLEFFEPNDIVEVIANILGRCDERARKQIKV